MLSRWGKWVTPAPCFLWPASSSPRIYIHNCTAAPFPLTRAKPGWTEGAVVAMVHRMPPHLLSPLFLVGNLFLQFLFEVYVLSLTLTTFLGLKCTEVTFFFFQEKFGAIVQLCFIFLMESLSVVLLHKIDWWQQILNELPFSVSKVDVMSHAVLATLKQLAMSVQTLLAVLTLGTH